MWRLALAALIAFVACKPPPPPYTFPGCPDPESTAEFSCPDQATFACAREKLLSKFANCSADSDCAVVTPPNASCLEGCPIAVSAERAGAFEDEFVNERARFCAESACSSSSENVGAVDGVCLIFLKTAAVCDAGRCALVVVDGGF